MEISHLSYAMSDFCDSCNPYFQYLPPNDGVSMVSFKIFCGNTCKPTLLTFIFCYRLVQTIEFTGYPVPCAGIWAPRFWLQGGAISFTKMLYYIVIQPIIAVCISFCMYARHLMKNVLTKIGWSMLCWFLCGCKEIWMDWQHSNTSFSVKKQLILSTCFAFQKSS